MSVTSDIEVVVDAVVIAGMAGVLIANIRSYRAWRRRTRPRHH